METSDSNEQSRPERLLGQAWDALPMAAVIVDQEGTIRHCSDQTSYLLGYEPGQLVGTQVDRLMAKREEGSSGDSGEEDEEGALQSRPRGNELEFLVRHQSGNAVPVRLSLTQVGDAEETDEIWTLLLMQDQRPYQDAEESGNQAEKRYWQLFNQNQVGLIWARLDGEVLSCNPAAAKIFGYETPDTFEGQSFGEHYRGDFEERRHTIDRLQKDGEVSKWNVPMKRQDGRPITILENLVLYEDTEFEGRVVVSSFVEVTEQARLWEELKEMAYHDPLTGLPNRRYLKEQARKIFALAQRRERFVGVAYVDLDGFKKVNDQWGHDTGDEVLVTIAERLKRTTRESDVVARIGGDEFAVLWADLDAPEESVTATRRIMRSFEKPFQVGGKTFALDLSVGVATFPTDGESINELLRRADKAMYQAKEEGGGVSVVPSHQQPQ